MEVFSAPLQQLMNEHVLLRADMDLFYETIEEIEFESGPTVIQLVTKLYEQISTFTEKLKAHSKREEEGLFPMMSQHLGENDRTIAEMEAEHQKAEQHLEDFLTEFHQEDSTHDETKALWMTTYAVQAHATLIQHFAKEEKVLFPLAEKILSAGEKRELERRLLQG